MMRKFFVMAALAVCVAVQGQESPTQEKCHKSCTAHKTHCHNHACCKDTTCQKRPYDQYKTIDCLDFDVALGWSLMTGKPDGMKTRFWGSREFLVGLRYEYTPKKALQSYSVGLWAKWSHYALDEKSFTKLDNGAVGMTEFPAGTSSTRSSINIFSLSVPFFFTQRFGEKSNWSVTLGPVVNINLRGRINNEYEIGDNDFDINTKGIEYRPLTVDLMGMITYKKVSIFCKYSPMTVFKKDMGPEFHAVSLGVFL